jgi:hypothetical protein
MSILTCSMGIYEIFQEQHTAFPLFPLADWERTWVPIGCRYSTCIRNEARAVLCVSEMGQEVLFFYHEGRLGKKYGNWFFIPHLNGFRAAPTTVRRHTEQIWVRREHWIFRVSPKTIFSPPKIISPHPPYAKIYSSYTLFDFVCFSPFL